MTDQELFSAESIKPSGSKTKGKTPEALFASRNGYAKILQEMGSLPDSIMVHDKSDKAIDLHAEERCYSSTLHPAGGAFEMSASGCQFGALSRFPQNIGRKLLLLYTKTGDTVVDPFAGHNSRMELCWRSNRNYIGQDLSREFMVANHTIRHMLLKEKETDMFSEHYKATIQLFEGDSRKMQAEDACGDFTITSPPYFDIEEYGDEPAQLGKADDYEAFLGGLLLVMRENFRCLKPGAFCVWCVNDFRRNGKFHSYHEDTAQRLRSVGFIQHDIAITDLGGSFGQCFPNRIFERKILPKRHEYCLVFKKP